MSRKKISELTATTDLASGDVFIVNDAGTTKKVDFDDLKAAIEDKSYIARFNQTGTDNPTITVIKNNTGETLTFTRTGTGVYKANVTLATDWYVDGGMGNNAAFSRFTPIYDWNGGFTAYELKGYIAIDSIDTTQDVIQITTWNSSGVKDDYSNLFSGEYIFELKYLG